MKTRILYGAIALLPVAAANIARALFSNGGDALQYFTFMLNGLMIGGLSLGLIIVGIIGVIDGGAK